MLTRKYYACLCILGLFTSLVLYFSFDDVDDALENYFFPERMCFIYSNNNSVS